MTRPHAQLPTDLTLHSGNDAPLLERLRADPAAVELILTPVELHRRNVQRRLRETQTPSHGIEFADPVDVGKRILEQADQHGMAPSSETHPDRGGDRDAGDGGNGGDDGDNGGDSGDGDASGTIGRLDRVDRLSMIRSLRSDDSRSEAGPAVPEDPQTIEQIRTEVEAVTGFHPDRLRRFREAAGTISDPIDADAIERIDSAVAIERALRDRTDVHVSDIAIVRHAVRMLQDTRGAAWQIAFPDVECISLVGVGSVPAAYVDLLHVLLETTSVPIHLYLRQGTGSYIARRLPDLFAIEKPGVVVFEP